MPEAATPRNAAPHRAVASQNGETTMSIATDAQARRTSRKIGALPYLLDIIVPLVAYYSLTSLGLSSFWSLVIGGALTAIFSIINTIRRRRIDNLGILVIVEITLGLVLDLTVRDPRLTLARGSLFIALAAIWVLVTTFTGRPVTVDATKPFAAKKGGQNGVIAFEWLAENSKPFIRIHRSLSTVWSLTFLAYAVIRVVVIYNVSISQAVWLNNIPGIIAVVICIIASARAGKQLEALVNDRIEQTAEKPNITTTSKTASTDPCAPSKA